ADARPDHGPRAAALEHLPRALPRLPHPRRDGLPVPQARGDEAGAEGFRRGQGLRPRRHAPHPLARRDPEEPRARDRRRGATLRRGAEGAAARAAAGGRRPGADGDADPAHAAHVALRAPRHLGDRDAAGRAPAHPYPRRRVRRRADQGGARARARARGSELLPAQPGGVDRRGGEAPAGALPGAAHPRRARADEGAGARGPDGRVPPRRRRRARLDDDHRVRPRHPAGEHADRRARRHARARPALPDPWPRRPLGRPRPRVPPLPRGGRAVARGAGAARDARRPHRARRRLRDRDARPRDPRRRRPARGGAVRSCRRARLRALRRAPERGGRRAVRPGARRAAADPRRRAGRRLRAGQLHRFRGAQDRPPPTARADRDRGRAARAPGGGRGPLRRAPGAGREPVRDPGGEAEARAARRGLPRLPRRARDGRAARARVGRAAGVALARRHGRLHQREARAVAAPRRVSCGDRAGRCYLGHPPGGLTPGLFPRMIRRPLAFLAPLFVLAVLVAGCGGGGKSSTSTTNATSTKLGAGVLAIVGKDKITVDQFNQIVDRAKRTYKQQKRPFPAVGSPDFKTLTGQIMNYLVERSELEQKADELGVKVTAAQVQAQIDKIKKQRGWSEQRLQQELKKTGITDADLRDTLRANLISEGLYNKVSAKVKVTDTEAKLYYDQHKSQYTTPASRRVRHILVKKKDLAEKL